MNYTPSQVQRGCARHLIPRARQSYPRHLGAGNCLARSAEATSANEVLSLGFSERGAPEIASSLREEDLTAEGFARCGERSESGKEWEASNASADLWASQKKRRCHRRHSLEKAREGREALPEGAKRRCSTRMQATTLQRGPFDDESLILVSLWSYLAILGGTAQIIMYAILRMLAR